MPWLQTGNHISLWSFPRGVGWDSRAGHCHNTHARNIVTCILGGSVLPSRPANQEGKTLGHALGLEVVEKVLPLFVVLPSEGKVHSWEFRKLAAPEVRIGGNVGGGKS